MALTSTIYTFEIDLSDVDRHVYESLALRVARHPSESEDYLVTRLVADRLEYTEGIAFSPGLSDPDEPTIAVRDLTGAIRTWIEIGAPDAARLHKAGKAASRVAVYTHRDTDQLLRQWSGARIHRAEALELYRVDRALLTAFIGRLERRMSFSVQRNSGRLYVSIGDQTIEGNVDRVSIS